MQQEAVFLCYWCVAADSSEVHPACGTPALRRRWPMRLAAGAHALSLPTCSPCGTPLQGCHVHIRLPAYAGRHTACAFPHGPGMDPPRNPISLKTASHELHCLALQVRRPASRGGATGRGMGPPLWHVLCCPPKAQGPAADERGTCRGRYGDPEAKHWRHCAGRGSLAASLSTLTRKLGAFGENLPCVAAACAHTGRRQRCYHSECPYPPTPNMRW